MTKQELMKELLDRYQQLDSLEGCKSAKDTVVLYIRKLEVSSKKCYRRGRDGLQRKSRIFKIL